MASNSEIKAIFLDFRRLRGVHSKKNIAEIVLEVIHNYEIECKIGYFVFNNAGFNDICVRKLIQYFSPFIKTKHRRFRCFGYVINLAAKAFLYGTDTELFEVEIKVIKNLKQAKKRVRNVEKERIR